MVISIISTYQVDNAGLAESEAELVFGGLKYNGSTLLDAVSSIVTSYTDAESEEYPDDVTFTIKTTAVVRLDIPFEAVKETIENNYTFSVEEVKELETKGI